MSVISRIRYRISARHEEPVESRHTGPDPADVVETACARETGICPRCGAPLDTDGANGHCATPKCGFAF